MANRYLRAKADGGLVFTETLADDETTPIFEVGIATANTAAASSHAQSDYVFMIVGGVLKKVALSNFTPVRKVVIPIVIPSQVISAMVGVFSQSFTPFADRPRKITAIHAVAADKWGTTGNTVFRIEDAGGNYADVTLAYNTLAATRVTCAIDLAVDEAFTVEPTSAADHSGVVIYAEMEIY